MDCLQTAGAYLLHDVWDGITEERESREQNGEMTLELLVQEIL